jgi:hypothetical protein
MNWLPTGAREYARGSISCADTTDAKVASRRKLRTQRTNLFPFKVYVDGSFGRPADTF